MCQSVSRKVEFRSGTGKREGIPKDEWEGVLGWRYSPDEIDAATAIVRWGGVPRAKEEILGPNRYAFR